MVLEFFRGSSGDGEFEHIITRSIAMLADARHSFDLATLALLTKAEPGTVAEDIRQTDERINLAEQELRSELVVHVSVKGGADIGTVLGFTLLLKKIERIGDQAKNILELSENNVTLAGTPEAEGLLAERSVLSSLFAEAGELLATSEVEDAALDDFGSRIDELTARYQAEIDGFMSSDRPGREVVPLAIYYRYLRRIAANLLGVVRTSSDPVPHLDYLEDGTVDTDD
ncbi:MAG: PhoU domain-containing protein [Actinomycetota bacterium]